VGGSSDRDPLNGDTRFSPSKVQFRSEWQRSETGGECRADAIIVSFLVSNCGHGFVYVKQSVGMINRVILSSLRRSSPGKDWSEAVFGHDRPD
jgi:hypothetical protein